MENFGAYHLSGKTNSSKYQPVRTNNFRVFIDFGSNDYTKNGLLKPGQISGVGDPAFPSQVAQEVIDFSVIEFKAPHFSQDDIQIKRGNSTIYFAGTPTFSEGSLRINDFISADGKSILMAWQALSYDVDKDTISSSDHYKVNATVIEYLPDNTEVRKWQLYGCWIKSLSEDDWNAESAGKKTVTATIRFDRAIPETTYGS